MPSDANKTYIIFCAGTSKHFRPPTLKQLLTVNGEIVLGRTVRLIRENEPEANIQIIIRESTLGKFKEQNFNAELVTVPDSPAPLGSSIQRMQQLQNKWGKNLTVFLWGDIWYSDECMKSICQNNPINYCYIHRVGPSKFCGRKSIEEAWALILKSNCYKTALDFINSQLEKSLKTKIKKTYIEQLVDKLEFVCYPNEVSCIIDFNDETEDFDGPNDIVKWTAAKGGKKPTDTTSRAKPFPGTKPKPVLPPKPKNPFDRYRSS